MKDANSNLGNFDPTYGMVQQGQAGFDSVWKGDPRDFEPRLGLAWDVRARERLWSGPGSASFTRPGPWTPSWGNFSCKTSNATSNAHPHGSY